MDQNSEVKENLLESIQKLRTDPKLRLEAKIGQFVPKSEPAKQDMDDYYDQFILLDQHILKKDYRFEACITKEDYQKAQATIPHNQMWTFTLDLIIDLTYETKNVYRFGVDEQGKYFCYERRKQLESKHLDIVDDGRNYRITVNKLDTIEYKAFQDIKAKIKDDYEREQEIHCVRYKETMIYSKDKNYEKSVFRVEQVNKNSKEFLHDIFCTLMQGDKLETNLDRVLDMLKQKSNYYKYFYEAEILLNWPTNPKSDEEIYQEILTQTREFYDNVRISRPRPSLEGVRYQKAAQNFNGRGRGRGSKRHEY